MSNEKETSQKEQAGASKGQPSTDAEPKGKKFSREQLVADSTTLLGQPPHIVVGALTDRQGNGSLTLKEAEAAISRFMGREVKES